MQSDGLQTGWTEEEDFGSVEMCVQFVGGGHLCVGKGRKHFVIGGAEVRVDVIK